MTEIFHDNGFDRHEHAVYLTVQDQYDLMQLPLDIRALKRAIEDGTRRGFGEAALANARRVLALKEERLAHLTAKRDGQERLL